MRVSTILLRWSAGRATPGRSGQILVLMAFAITVLFGMIGLAVDVGHAYERRQFVQGAAHNAARAGAFEVYANSVAGAPLSGSQEDAVVVQRMVDTLGQSGLTVRNLGAGGTTFTNPPSWSACKASPAMPPTQVYLQAFYVDDQNQQIHAGAGPIAVGAGTAPSWALGVEVTRLAMCVPHFFTAVLRHGNFDVGASFVVGLTETTGSFDQANAPFYIYGAKRIVNGAYAPTLYAEDAPDLPAPSPPNPPYAVKCNQTGLGAACQQTPGDLVTLHNSSNAGGKNSGNWDSWQYYQAPYGSNYIPSGFALHDASNRGCLDPSDPNQDLANLHIDSWYFNHGGTGHCGTVPNVGDTVEIPIVDEVCKQNNCGDGTQIPLNAGDPCYGQPGGGFCVRIVAFVLVYIQTITGGNGDLVQGYITNVVDDPYCIVELPPGKHHQPCNPVT